MVTRLFAPALIDDKPLEPTKIDKPKRRRGRPLGSTTSIAHPHIGADEFAMLRAVAQGVDIAVAARQFILWPGRVPEKSALIKIYGDLLLRVEAAAAALEDRKTARRMVRNLVNYQTVISQDLLPSASQPGEPISPEVSAPANNSTNVPSLEEFAEQYDEDMFSEAELIERYEEEYGHLLKPLEKPEPTLSVNKDSNDSSFTTRMNLQLKSIDWLDRHLGRKPEREHQLEQWVRLSDKQLQAIRKKGMVTLGNLVDWMSLRGDRWVQDVPGYGHTRAKNLTLWLQRWEIKPGSGLQAVAIAGDRRPKALTSVEGMHPLTALQWPVMLNGEFGRFRTFEENSLEARDDREAVQAWFRLLRDKSRHTQKAYQRAIERLTLWAIHERKQALSSLSAMDMQDFKEFLTNPPPHWVQDPKAARERRSASWRPLKGPLTEASLNVTFAAVSAMYRHWQKSRYIKINPASELVSKRADEMAMDVMRSFSDGDLEIVARTFEEIPDGPAKRRLKAVLRLLELGGLRRGEACKATWGDVHRVRVGGRITEDLCLEVVGKGNRQRFVPLTESVLDALKEHLQDRRELMAAGKMQQFRSIPDKDLPLLGVLDDRWIVAHDKKLSKIRASDQADTLPVDEDGVRKFTVNMNGGISEDVIYRVLKDFFRKCAETAGEHEGDISGTFRRASTHWLRHTFAHHLLRETQKDLPVVQALLGHKSITTTAIYVKADLEARVAGVKKLKSSI